MIGEIKDYGKLTFREREEWCDGNCSYDITFNNGENDTVKDLVDEILKSRGFDFGSIRILVDYRMYSDHFFECCDVIEYERGKIIKANDKFNILANAHIAWISANGDRGRMNYSVGIAEKFIIMNDMLKLERGSMGTDIRVETKIDEDILSQYFDSLLSTILPSTTRRRPLGIVWKVIFSNNCTIVCTNNAKVVCKCRDEEFDEEKGLYIALLKLNGYTYSRLKRELERIGCMSDKAEKAYAYAVLINKYKYSDITLTSILENAVRQNKKEVN